MPETAVDEKGRAMPELNSVVVNKEMFVDLLGQLDQMCEKKVAFDISIEFWGGWLSDEKLKGLVDILNASLCHGVSIYVHNSRSVTDIAMAHLATLRSLQILDINNCKLLTDRCLTSLAGHESLRILNLQWLPKLTDEGLKHLSNLPLLENLVIHMCAHVMGPGIPHLMTLIANNVNHAQSVSSQFVRVDTRVDCQGSYWCFVITRGMHTISAVR